MVDSAYMTIAAVNSQANTQTDQEKAEAAESSSDAFDNLLQSILKRSAKGVTRGATGGLPDIHAAAIPVTKDDKDVKEVRTKKEEVENEEVIQAGMPARAEEEAMEAKPESKEAAENGSETNDSSEGNQLISDQQEDSESEDGSSAAVVASQLVAEKPKAESRDPNLALAVPGERTAAKQVKTEEAQQAVSEDVPNVEEIVTKGEGQPGPDGGIAHQEAVPAQDLGANEEVSRDLEDIQVQGAQNNKPEPISSLSAAQQGVEESAIQSSPQVAQAPVQLEVQVANTQQPAADKIQVAQGATSISKAAAETATQAVQQAATRAVKEVGAVNAAPTFSEKSSQTAKTASGKVQEQSANPAKAVEQIQKMLEDALKAKSGNTIVVKLNPEELGSVTVRVTQRADQIYARVTPESAEVEKALRANISEVTHALTNAGIKAENIHVVVGHEMPSMQHFSLENSYQEALPQDKQRSTYTQGMDSGAAQLPEIAEERVSNERAGWVA